MKNKVLFILSFFIIILSFFTVNCFAYTYDDTITYNDNNYYLYIPDGAYNSIIEMPEFLNDDYNYLMGCGNGKVYITYWLNTYDLKIYLNGSYSSYLTNVNSLDGFTCKTYEISENGGTPSLISSSSSVPNVSGAYTISDKIYMLTNVNIYTDNTYTSFFLDAPVQQTIMVQELEKIQVQEIWKNLMKKIVVSLLVFLIGFIAFLKCWNWLKTQLHKS